MEIPRPPADTDERYDIDTNEDGSLTAAGNDEPEDTAAEIVRAEKVGSIASKIMALSDLAERECTAQQLAAARIEFREWMRNHHGHNGAPLTALALRLKEMGGATTLARGLVVHAAKEALAEGREGREAVPSMDAPAGDPGARVKGRKGKKGAAKGPQKSKRSTGFVSRIGSTVVGFRTAFGVDDARLLEMLRAGGFARLPEQIMSAPEFGFCPIDDPSIGTGDLTSLPTIGSDPEWVIFGLRRDAKTGCPTHRFRFEAEAEATREALAAGKTNAPAFRIKELQEAKVTAWYRTATPQTTVFPCTWHRPTWTLYVHTDNTAAVDAAVLRAGQTLGAIERLPSLIAGAKPEEVTRTDLRSEDVAGTGTADLGADLLLWLVGRQLGGTGVVQLGDDGGKLEWWLEDAVDLERSTADDKKLRVKLAGAPAEGGSLAAGLADGATLKSARLALRVDEMTFKVTLSGGVGRGWGLPTTTKPDGTPAGLDAAIDERLRLWQRGSALLDVLINAAMGDRYDRGTWMQRMTALRRQLGLEMVKRWGYDAKTGVGYLFAHMLPGEQTTLGSVKVADGREAAPKSRGARARGAAAEA